MTDINTTSSKRKLTDYLRKETLKEFLHNLISLKISSSKIALSIAIGIFIGLMIPIGLQTVIIVPLATLLGCNVIVATTSTLISNPITMLPLYYTAIKIGEFLTGKSLSWDNFETVISSPTWGNLTSLGGDGLLVFFSGSTLMGIIFGVITYFITLNIIIKLRERKAQKSTSV